jgi:cytochrome c554/c'-like protein
MWCSAIASSTEDEYMHMRNGAAWALSAGLLLAVPLQLIGAEEAPKPQYVGVARCGRCHRRESTGDQLGQWKNTGHARAYATLASEESKAIAQERGIQDPQQSDVCLKCHVTAHGVDAALIAPIPEGKKGYSVEDGLACESCHGAGSLYASRKVMRNREAALAAGMAIPDEALCRTCHNPESPAYQEFMLAEMWKKVLHPNPKKVLPPRAEQP